MSRRAIRRALRDIERAALIAAVAAALAALSGCARIPADFGDESDYARDVLRLPPFSARVPLGCWALNVSPLKGDHQFVVVLTQPF